MDSMSFQATSLRSRNVVLTVLAIAFWGCCQWAGAQTPRSASNSLTLLHPLFQDHAVLQREQPIKVWGWSAPGDAVTVSLAGSSMVARANGTGRWDATLPPMSAGGPYQLDVRAQSGAAQTAKDILIGDVWLCSGQSNMELQVHRALNSRSEIARSANDSIRMLTLRHASSATPLETFTSSVEWQPAAPATVPEFSATCFYFARELQKTVHVPMGLIHSSWGGSTIQTWMSERALRTAGGYDKALDVLHLYTTDRAQANQRWGELWQAWWRGRDPQHEPWNPARLQKSDWSSAPPALGVWEDWGVPELAHFNGMVWFRTTLKLTAKQAAQSATLSLGTIDEVDQTWLNGRPLGNDSGADVDRVYPVTAGRLRAGENTIVVNVLDTYGNGGIYGSPEKRALRLQDGALIPLNGEWRYQIVPASLGEPLRAPWEAVAGLTMIHNAMISPLGACSLRGMVWYQGEANTGESERYRALLTSLMSDWRNQFGADLPFLVVQLAGYGSAATAPQDSEWARLREAQRLAVEADAHAGLAVAVDIGDRYDIHPANKQEVGQRLARAARHVAYGEKIAPSGPIPLGAKREGEHVVVTFTDVQGDLQVYGGKRPVGFELCGAGQATCRFVDALASGDQVTLDLPDDLAAPTRVRFCWADSPVCTLYDKSGLPAGPFELAVP